MHWFVINPYDGEIEFDCPDDSEGQNNVLGYLLDDSSRFRESGTPVARMIVIRGERYDFQPPTQKSTLVLRNGPMG